MIGSSIGSPQIKTAIVLIALSIAGLRWVQMGRMLSDIAVTAEEIDRAVASGSRKSRARTGLRQQIVPELWFDRGMDARVQLRTVKATVSTADWSLLSAVAEGYSYANIAAEMASSAGALRIRVHRIRDLLDRCAA